MNRSECSKIIAILATNDRTGTVTPATIEAWAMVMADIPYDAAQAAACEWLKHHKWFPMPSEFRDILVNALTGLPQPEEAWAVVMDRMRSTYPGHPTPDWEAPEAIRRAVESIGGMAAIRMSDQPAEMAQRFASSYRRYRDRALHDFDIGDAWREALDAGRTVALPTLDRPAVQPERTHDHG